MSLSWVTITSYMSKTSLLMNSKQVCRVLLSSYFIFQKWRRDQISHPNLLVLVLTGYTLVLATQLGIDNLKKSEIGKTEFSVLLFLWCTGTVVLIFSGEGICPCSRLLFQLTKTPSSFSDQLIITTGKLHFNSCFVSSLCHSYFIISYVLNAHKLQVMVLWLYTKSRQISVDHTQSSVTLPTHAGGGVILKCRDHPLTVLKILVFHWMLLR